MDKFDFNEWENPEENPTNPWSQKNGFFYFNGNKEQFRKMWEDIVERSENPIDYLQKYMHLNELNDIKKQQQSQDKSSKRQPRGRQTKVVHFTQDEYLKLIEIRGYLSITEQYAHVKALDKVLNHINVNDKGPLQ